MMQKRRLPILHVQFTIKASDRYVAIHRKSSIFLKFTVNFIEERINGIGKKTMIVGTEV